MAISSVGNMGGAALVEGAKAQFLGGKSGAENGLFDKLLAQADNKKDGAPNGASSHTNALIDKDSKLYEQCVELETFVLKTLVNGMKSTVMKSGLLDTGFAGGMYEDMLYDEYAKMLAQNADFGLKDSAYLELSGQRGKAGVNIKT